MIGDWVQIRYCRKLKLSLDQFYARGCHELRGNPIDYFSTFDPIPLTKEMLKANGFEYDGMFWHYGNEFGRVFVRFCSIEEDNMSEEAYNYYVNHWIFDENFRIDYAHELQHALRLCGLNELADNFII